MLSFTMAARTLSNLNSTCTYPGRWTSLIRIVVWAVAQCFARLPITETVSTEPSSAISAIHWSLVRASLCGYTSNQILMLTSLCVAYLLLWMLTAPTEKSTGKKLTIGKQSICLWSFEPVFHWEGNFHFISYYLKGNGKCKSFPVQSY